MPFFIRKKGGGSKRPAATPQPKKKARRDVEISSESEDDGFGPESATRPGVESGSESDAETAQEKRQRLAKALLASVKAEAAAKGDDDEESSLRAILSDKVAAAAGRLQKERADAFRAAGIPSAPRFVLRGHRRPPTAVLVSADATAAVSASKDGAIIKWNLETGTKVKKIDGRSPKLPDPEPSDKIGGAHRGAVLCLALSSDDKFLCTGGEDKKVQVWDFATMTPIRAFTGHKKAVTGLCFRRGEHQLFSGSADRSVKVWSLDDLGYVDTMFGHQDGVESVDALGRERFISCGGRDRSIRIWKVAEESQLLFHPHKGAAAVDAVRLVNEEKFVTGADDGSISLWSVLKKKPLHVEHGCHTGTEPWVSAVAPLLNSDVLASASGSVDGAVKLWQIPSDYKSLAPIGELPVTGFVNDLRWSGDGRFLLCAVGQEHKKGRWWTDKAAKNAVLVFHFPA